MAKFHVTCVGGRTQPAGTLVCTAVSRDHDTERIAFAGDLDADTTDGFTRTVRRTLATSRQPHLLIDLAQVGFLAAAGVQALLDCQRIAARHGRRLTVCNPQPLVLRVLRITSACEMLTVSVGDRV